MKPVLPAKVRAGIYFFTALATPIMAYLYSQGTITEFIFGLYTVFGSAVNALAYTNVTPDIEE